MFAFVFVFVFQYQAKRLAGKNVSEMTSAQSFLMQSPKELLQTVYNIL